MEQTIFEEIFGPFSRPKVKLRPEGANRRAGIDELTGQYLRELNGRQLAPDAVRNELRAIFKMVRDECEAYGRGKRQIQMNILRVVRALEEGINAKRGEYLLAKWKGWEDMLNPAAPNYLGINLPGSMVIENFIVFEDIIPIREHFEQRYHDGSFERQPPV